MQLMEVVGVKVELPLHAPVLILRDADLGTVVPIWIGEAEATAISTALEHVPLERPSTHDLMAALIAGSGGPRVERVEIVDAHEGCFAAVVCLSHGLRVDARPSDAVALALRLDAPVYCAKRVLNMVGVEGRTPQPLDLQEFRSFLEDVSIDDFL